MSFSQKQIIFVKDLNKQHLIEKIEEIWGEISYPQI